MIQTIGEIAGYLSVFCFGASLGIFYTIAKITKKLASSKEELLSMLDDIKSDIINTKNEDSQNKK